MEKENNEILIKKNFDIDSKYRKIEKYQKEFENLSTRVRNVAPWLQKFMEKVDAINNAN